MAADLQAPLCDPVGGKSRCCARVPLMEEGAPVLLAALARDSCNAARRQATNEALWSLCFDGLTYWRARDRCRALAE